MRALATLRDLAVFLVDERDKNAWALVDVHDVEAFLSTLPKGRKRRLTVLRQFFRFARSQEMLLVDATWAGSEGDERLPRPDPRPRPAARAVQAVDNRQARAPA
ncbi:hypothetical protein ACWCQW_53430 [Streptomyces mirabilis]